ncbi:MAG: Wzz/FepE/Etk N-terminal domain-containing protein, partial [Bacteroidota bacterium]
METPPPIPGTSTRYPDPPGPDGGIPRLRLLPFLRALGVAWKRILILSLAAAAVTLGVNFLLPVYYQATTTLLPETEKGKLSALEQFADVAQLAGVKMPGSEVSRLYPIIVRSETILRAVIARTYRSERFAGPVDLIRYFELEEDTPEEEMDEALRTIDRLLGTVHESRSGLVEVTLEMREPGVAADVLNAIVEELDSFMRLKRISNATEQRKWIGVRLTEVEAELREAEERLKKFREENRRVLDSPQLMLEEGRRLREVQVKSTIFVELQKQSELARIDEIKNITIVNVLDAARPPVRKERPRRLLNTALVFGLALVLLSAWEGGRAVYG